ncbi:MAG TPA: isochorismatase family protein [Roseiarcus sp.]|nr:isochorismatase family protein [Roseiarcus sp.]
MRLPADATLIVVGAQDSIEGRLSKGGGRRVEANLASLIAAWRKEDLPIVQAYLDSAPSASFKPSAATPVDGEAAIAAGAAGAFFKTEPGSLLEDAGVTTLVLCGALSAVEQTARDAENLGYRIFIPLDACWPAASPADPAIARLSREGAAVVDTAATLSAAAMAKARQRRDAERRR